MAWWQDLISAVERYRRTCDYQDLRAARDLARFTGRTLSARLRGQFDLSPAAWKELIAAELMKAIRAFEGPPAEIVAFLDAHLPSALEREAMKRRAEPGVHRYRRRRASRTLTESFTERQLQIICKRSAHRASSDIGLAHAGEFRIMLAEMAESENEDSREISGRISLSLGERRTTYGMTEPDYDALLPKSEEFDIEEPEEPLEGAEGELENPDDES